MKDLLSNVGAGGGAPAVGGGAAAGGGAPAEAAAAETKEEKKEEEKEESDDDMVCIVALESISLTKYFYSGLWSIRLSAGFCSVAHFLPHLFFLHSYSYTLYAPTHNKKSKTHFTCASEGYKIF